jgi:hypothetical protein
LATFCFYWCYTFQIERLIQKEIAVFNRMAILCAIVSGISVSAFAQRDAAPAEPLKFPGVAVSTYPQEVRTFYSTAEGLPSDDVRGIAISGGAVYAATDKGLAKFSDGKWGMVAGGEGTYVVLGKSTDGIVAIRGNEVIAIKDDAVLVLAQLPEKFATENLVNCIAAQESKVWIGTDHGLFVMKGTDVERLDTLAEPKTAVVQIAIGPEDKKLFATSGGLYVMKGDEIPFRALFPHVRHRCEIAYVSGAAFDSAGNVWFSSPEGIGTYQLGCTLYTPEEGLPSIFFTTMAPAENGAMWFGTKNGAIRFDGKTWEYRQGKNWLPSDNVRAIAVNENGDAWFATDAGVGLIERKPMTLAKKAAYFNDELDKYNRRTPYGYVLEARLDNPNDKSKVTNHDSDNDGLWTAMYGASECFRYAATKDPEAKKRAVKAFEALRFLSEVTQGGEHPAPKGFPARSILPTDGRNPNDQDNAERDRRNQERDPAWKILEPRWPVSADGKWYWKTDTSSDELDGHYFFYATYYDLVAETDEEKARVRETTLAITDHLLAHDYALVDHDGKPTRWAQYSPKVLNYDTSSGGRGLNSLSILSYLKVALHMSGDEKYQTAYRDLIDNHAYAMNTLIPKTAMGPGNGNQSDDEMAFMSYYNLFKYEKDPELLQFYNRSLFQYFQLEQREMCPLFNYIFAACLEGQTMRGLRRFSGGSFLEEALDTLKRYRLDRVQWELKNSERLDVVKFSSGFGRGGARGHLLSGKVLPIDERNVNHWNHDPWDLDYGGDGRELTDGAAFLLPYYMGLHHGYILEK